MARFQDWLTVSDPKFYGETLAEQFRLSSNELQRAMEALAPAFRIGFERALGDPSRWADLSRAFWGMVPASEAAGAGGARAAKLPGHVFLEAFFGSDALAGAVARQASLVAGIAPDVLKQLMPSLAMLTMQGMAGQAVSQLSRQQPAGLAEGDFAAATAEMMRRGANAIEALAQPSDQAARRGVPAAATAGAAVADMFGEALKAGLPFFGFAGASAPAPARETPHRDRLPEAAPAPAFNPMLPFAALFDAFAQGMQTAPAPGAAGPSGASPAGGTPAGGSPAGAPPTTPTPAGTTSSDRVADSRPAKATASHDEARGTSPRPAASSPEPESDESFVGEMIRSSQKLQDDYAKEMAALFERYGNGPRHS